MILSSSRKTCQKSILMASTFYSTLMLINHTSKQKVNMFFTLVPCILFLISIDNCLSHNLYLSLDEYSLRPSPAVTICDIFTPKYLYPLYTFVVHSSSNIRSWLSAVYTHILYFYIYHQTPFLILLYQLPCHTLHSPHNLEPIQSQAKHIV